MKVTRVDGWDDGVCIVMGSRCLLFQGIFGFYE